jgi:hypothetical protein
MTAARARGLFAEGFDLKDNLAAVWCADRFGQTITFLEDGRAVQIGGEHEDYDDVDFHIYNDVIVHDADGALSIYGYPLTIFCPTDFHSATLVGSDIVVIGGSGYLGTREPGRTRVYCLNTNTFAMRRIDTSGDNPGWIFRHRATLVGPRTIRVTGGQVATVDEEDVESVVDNDALFELDVDARTWRRVTVEG